MTTKIWIELCENNCFRLTRSRQCQSHQKDRITNYAEHQHWLSKFSNQQHIWLRAKLRPRPLIWKKAKLVSVNEISSKMSFRKETKTTRRCWPRGTGSALSFPRYSNYPKRTTCWLFFENWKRSHRRRAGRGKLARRRPECSRRLVGKSCEGSADGMRLLIYQSRVVDVSKGATASRFATFFVTAPLWQVGSQLYVSCLYHYCLSQLNKLNRIRVQIENEHGNEHWINHLSLGTIRYRKECTRIHANY